MRRCLCAGIEPSEFVALVPSEFGLLSDICTLISRNDFHMADQSTSTIMMVRPATFRRNEQTAVNNHFQKQLADKTDEEVLDLALAEFDGFVDKLRKADVNVLVFEADSELDAPDALFPNNWVSFHHSGAVGLYPMFAENRRIERRDDIIHDLEHLHGFEVTDIIDFTEFEEHNKFLEGTGSLVLDRQHNRAYAALSPRTDRLAFAHFCDEMDMDGVAFHAMQDTPAGRAPIYHTNVMMAIGSGFAAVCLDCIDDAEERTMVRESLEGDGLEVIALNEEEINHFAGNMLEVQSRTGETMIVMSEQAHQALRPETLGQLARHGKILPAPLATIETCGGGSARCMLAEIHLPSVSPAPNTT